jgi:acyl-CoA reductase-like NAD-dependent aldehyde dehydrogenase
VTNNLDDFQEVSSQLRAGQVYVNSYMGVQENTPFGGFKSSGIGRELGEGALKNFTETRTVIMKKPDALC